MRKEIPFLSMDYQLTSVRRDVNAAIARVMDSGNLILGNEVARFEQRYAKFTGVSYTAGVGNGYDALFLSLRALRIGKGDEVIVPSNTCLPTWLAVSATGATVVPVDPSVQTFNIEAAAMSSAITSRTKAIVPVHLYGQSCVMGPIMDLAAKHRIHVVEDNAQSHGSSFAGKMTGSFGVVNATSFYPTKNLGALGDGGAITTNNKELLDQIFSLRNYGNYRQQNARVRGVNSRLDEMQAAVLNVRLGKLRTWNKLRKTIARTYHRQLRDVPGLTLPVIADDCDHVYHLFVVRTKERDRLRQFLQTKGIGTMIHYPIPPHQNEAYRDHHFRRGQFPVADEISATALSLPCWPGMTATECDRVVDAIRQFF